RKGLGSPRWHRGHIAQGRFHASRRPRPGMLASINKLWWPVAHQRLTELGLRMSSSLGEDPDYWYRAWLDARPEPIYGGSAQVQGNMISEGHLGMPRK